ncbi:hypothetical protein [Nonomuraea salmonea]|uniref:hypothetical protein n=1 Tax=Nonomuraea salmonea TaxID=46181 RepID=UPI0031EDC7CF
MTRRTWSRDGGEVAATASAWSAPMAMSGARFQNGRAGAGGVGHVELGAGGGRYADEVVEQSVVFGDDQGAVHGGPPSGWRVGGPSLAEWGWAARGRTRFWG